MRALRRRMRSHHRKIRPPAGYIMLAHDGGEIADVVPEPGYMLGTYPATGWSFWSYELGALPHVDPLSQAPLMQPNALLSLPSAVVRDHDTSGVAIDDPALGTRLRVFWPQSSSWFHGKVVATTIQDGEAIHRVLFDDGDRQWYNLSDPQHRWELEVPIGSAAGSSSGANAAMEADVEAARAAASKAAAAATAVAATAVAAAAAAASAASLGAVQSDATSGNGLAKVDEKVASPRRKSHVSTSAAPNSKASRKRPAAEGCEDCALPNAPTGRRVTMWNSSQTDGGPIFWHGHVKQLMTDGGAQIVSDQLREGSGCSIVMRWEASDWCWGEWRRRPSIIGREAAKAAAYEAEWNVKTSVSKPHPRRMPVDASVVTETKASRAGDRAWAPAFMRCIDALAILQSLMLRAGWPGSTPAMEPAELHESWLAQLNAGGMTALVTGAIKLLKRVPRAKWDGGEWSDRGDWSERLVESNCPEDLVAHLVQARERVIQWPERIKDAVAACAASSIQIVPAVLTSPCFACGHASSSPHPALSGKRLCDKCRQRYETVEWIEDGELLDLICGGCAHSGATPHGCRDCGASLCERCFYALSGSRALTAARRHRFHPEICPGCEQEDDELAVHHVGVRVACDACRQEWHPRCHTPALTSLPGLSKSCGRIDPELCLCHGCA